MRTPFFLPDWTPPVGVQCLMTTRLGGVSPPPYDSMNVGSTSGDLLDNVSQNKKIVDDWIKSLGLKQGRACYLKQVHGTKALNLDQCSLRLDLARGQELKADACYTTTRGVVCAVRVADCMPVFLAVPGGVAAIHAGWRGLAKGVVHKTLEKLLHVTQQTVQNVSVWLGPCIGNSRFEVGDDVKQAFESVDVANRRAFKSIPTDTDHWLADLHMLAKEELMRYGVEGENIWVDERCTYVEEQLFYSYRRDQIKLGGTGRMLACIWMDEL